MRRSLPILLLFCLLSACSVVAEGSGGALPPIIAIGDVHGDYQQFVKLLRATGLVDKRTRWIAGETHFVQLGDIPDRGPDTRKIMDLLMKLEKSAKKKGGEVTVLIGNHEMMNMTDDLRFVDPGEYAAFADRNSKTLRKRYYQQVVAHLTNNLPEEEVPLFDDAWQKGWESRHPLGYVEHRMAWSPGGKYGKWTLSHKAVHKVGDSLFLHGGLSPKYAAMSLAEINTRVRTDLVNKPPLSAGSILDDELGPLWYRGWSFDDETPENEALLDTVLEAFEVKRMVIAHTPILPVVLPRFGGKVLVIDVGLSAHYGNGFSALRIEGDTASALIGTDWIALPHGTGKEGVVEYLDEVLKVIDNPGRIPRYRERLLTPPEPRPVNETKENAPHSEAALN